MTTTRRIEIPPCYGDAHLRAQSFDADTNSIAVIWTTGASVTRRGPDGYYDEELVVTPEAVRLDRLNAGAPFLDSHRDGRLEHVIGSVVTGTARITGGQGRARIKLSGAQADADNVQKIRDGIIRNISVGYILHRVEIVEREGQLPIWRVVDWEPIEISAVPVPADPGAHIRNGQRAGAIARSAATITTLDYWSVPACRARMLAQHRRLGLLPDKDRCQ